MTPTPKLKWKKSKYPLHRVIDGLPYISMDEFNGRFKEESEHIISEERSRVAREIFEIIVTQRDNGNVVGGGFSAAICLSEVLKKLKEYGVK